MTAIKPFNAATSTISSDTAKSAPKAQMTAVQKRGPEPWFPTHWDIVTEDNGAVLARATGMYGAGGYAATPTTRDITLAPAASITEGVNTYTFAIPRASGIPVFKITPFTFETMDGMKMAFGQDTFDDDGIEDKSGLQTTVAIRNHMNYTDAKDPGDNMLVNHTIRAYQQILGISHGTSVEEYKAFLNASASASASMSSASSLAGLSTGLTSPVASAPATTASAIGQSASKGLSGGTIAGIAVGATGGVFALGVLVLGLVRANQKGKRAAEIETFKMTKLSNVNTNVSGSEPSAA